MRGRIPAAVIGMVLMLLAANAFAKESPRDISGYLPPSGEVPGWMLSDAFEHYRGDELFMMIDGGADIYHEYGFIQIISADYAKADGKSIRVEIYEMENPAAAYGIYSFKIGEEGKAPAIGQEAILENYYLNFWKGDLLVTVIGSDADEETVRGVLALAKAVDTRIPETGKRPALAEMLLREPLAFSNPTYVRGAIGVLNSYVFDSEDIFAVREGMIGTVDNCRVMVFRYPDDGESSRIYESAIARLAVGSRFTDGGRQANQYAMVGRSREVVLINQSGPYIAIVISPNRDRVTSTSGQLVEKLNNKGNGSYAHMTTDNFVRDIVNHPAFTGFGQYLLPWDDNSSYFDTPLKDVRLLLPYHNHVDPGIVVDAINHMIDEISGGKTMFYEFYNDRQKQENPSKKSAGLFFFRGKPGAPFAVLCPGGGFAYVGSLHEGFPHARALNRKGYNAFVLRYRTGSGSRATEDLAAAIAYIFKNADRLEVSVANYSLWGSSAGARMVGNIALSGTAEYGVDDLPGPRIVVIAYTGHEIFSENFPPTFITVSEDDGIVHVPTVDKRVENMKTAGIEVEYRKYKHAGHGFGLGTGTDAEGWIEHAIEFWGNH